MKIRELYRRFRRWLQDKIDLRVRLTAMFTVEMLLCIGVAYVLDLLINRALHWQVPLEAEMAFVCLLVGIVVTSQMSKLFFRPVKKLGEAMEQVSMGNFTVRLSEKVDAKEIRDINAGFNLMASELGSMEILQSDFVSNVSHEFKTPINAIEGYSTLLQDSDALDESQREYVEKILFNTQRLSTLVGSVLLLSKLENQQIPTNPASYRLDEQIRQSIVALEPAWDRKDIELDVDLQRLEYTGSESMLHHVWDNLISNAIKFSPPGGIVRIRLEKQAEQLCITVEDQGPGLSETAMKHIFDKFYQADTAHKQEGSGLGLALVKRILTIEKGSVTAHNRPEGGCCFTVLLRSK